MKKNKLIFMLILLGFVLCIPSIMYLVKNSGNIAGYDGQYSYKIENIGFLNKYGWLIFAWTITLMFIVYLRLIKASNQFKGIKEIILSAIVVGIVFLAILPNTSKDVFFYIGNGRAIDKYNVNPYVTSVSEIEEQDLSDSILKTVGIQKDFKFVYGPVFLAICGLLSKISFSSLSLFLYEFKILNFIVYLLTIYLIYKLTKKKKHAIIFAFNPLVLLEVLVNAHNDIFVVFFALLGLFFVKEADKKYEENFLKSEITFLCGLMFLVISALIKYVVIIIVPFVILYRLRKEGWVSKILNSLLYLLVFFGIFCLPYMPYCNNFSEMFSGALIQSGKLKDSIYMIVAILTDNDAKVVSYFYSVGFFALLYIFIVKILLQCFRKNNFKSMMENCYIILFLLIFIGLTNLTSWYLIWLFIPVFWTNGEKLKNMLWLGFLYELTYTIFYFSGSDSAAYQIWILPFVAFFVIVRKAIGCLKYIIRDDY